MGAFFSAAFASIFTDPHIDEYTVPRPADTYSIDYQAFAFDTILEAFYEVLFFGQECFSTGRSSPPQTTGPTEARTAFIQAQANQLLTDEAYVTFAPCIERIMELA